MSPFPRKRLAPWLVLFGLAFPAACGSSGVVGGDCAASYVECNGRCVDALTDPANCGGCGRACEPGVSCQNAECVGSLDGGAGTSSTGGNAGAAGTPAEAGAGGASAASGNGGAAGDDAGMLSDAGPDGDASCGPPYDRPEACGDCMTQCAAPTPSCASDGMGNFHCVKQCEAPPFDRPEACGDCTTKCSADKPICAPDGSGGFACRPQCDQPPSSYDTPEMCGDCLTQCVAPTPNCSPDDVGSFHCVLNCTAPLKACSGKCVDFNIDADNCGSCGHVCPSGICQSATCVGANVGHVVLACMDYQTPVKNSAQTVLMGNAVLLPIRNPVRILAYAEFAPAAARAKVDQDIGFAAAARGRSFTLTTLGSYSNATATLSIADYDVFLIYDQTSAPAGKLADVGAAWQANSVLDSFAAAGGVIVGLSGGSSEMDQFFSASQLLDVSAETVVSGSTLYNRAPGDAMGINVISPFFAPASSCTFTTSVPQDQATIFVVSDAQTGAGAPVVVHRVIAP